MTVCNGQPMLIDGPAGKLELLCEVGDTAGQVMIICHPHTLHGGTMQNKVVHTLARTATALGMVAIRFNFRGAGNSEGHYDDGRGELDDLIAVVCWAQQQYPGLAIGLAGFSFGSYVAWQAAATQDVVSLITVAPPVTMYPFDRLPAPRLPWLLVQGEQDEIIDATAVLDWAGQHDGVEIKALPDCSHFFHRRLAELSTVVEQWCRQVFQRADTTDQAQT